MSKNILKCEVEGFIGGHLVNYFRNKGNFNIVCVDIKPLEYWLQTFDNTSNFSFDPTNISKFSRSNLK
jgi:hypothetical protein